MKNTRKMFDYHDIGCAKIDVSRWQRVGIPEAVYCPGKSILQIQRIVRAMIKKKGPVILTRADRKIFNAVRRILTSARFFADARMIVSRSAGRMASAGSIAVITGGTADIPVAEEAAVTAETLGCRVQRLYDVGVAGVHRLFMNRNILDAASCVIVCAGMEGALASVAGGLVGVPVIAVPTSVGYGASFKGIAPLLTMLNSCAPNVSVVNIDNGFGAGVMAHCIVKKKV